MHSGTSADFSDKNCDNDPAKTAALCKVTQVLTHLQKQGLSGYYLLLLSAVEPTQLKENEMISVFSCASSIELFTGFQLGKQVGLNRCH